MNRIHFHAFTALLAVLAFLTSSLVILNQINDPTSRVSAAETACPSGNTIFLNNTAITSSMTVGPGLHKVSLAVSSVLAPNVRSVVFKLDNDTTILGRGVQVNNNPYYEMQWQSQVTSGGQHSIGATIYLNSGSCGVAFVPVMLSNNTTSGHLTVAASPAFFEGYTNEPRNFVLSATTVASGTALNVSPWAYFSLNAVSLGIVSPADGSNQFRFSAGPTAGSSAIKVAVHYGGNTTLTDIPIKVLAQTANPTTNASGSTGTTGVGTTTATTSTSSAPTALETDEPVKKCVVSKIGEARYTLITSGKDRPSGAEFEAFNQCFAIRNYVIPGSWAPVEAKKETILSRPASAAIKVSDAENVTDTLNGSKKQTLKFSGKAKPNAKVILYIFSEPLVVTTSADNNGDWSYALEDPLEPGKHEAYALVSKGDGSYERSSVFSFAVAKAEAAPANPNGLSLNLERNQPTAQKSTTSLRMYVIGVVALVILVAGLAWNLHRIRAKKSVPHDGSENKDVPPPPPPAGSMNEPVKQQPQDEVHNEPTGKNQ